MKILYDTSVLIAALLVEHTSHNLAFPKLELARRGEVKGYISTHSLAEIYAVITRLPQPLRVLPAEAEVAIADLLEYLEPVPLLTQEYQKAIALMTTQKLGGGGIFDAVIAQAALKVEADCILTLNPKDFTRLGDEIAVRVQMPE
ncbi:MAG: tRNA(fMet)-specific endonuclease VapC [Chroococcidiopsis cubana SAG 39.79]|jgi:predicted nucleic acid-binding protein|uniref:Ribonuclease VapC n=2 Tax=Chroococcidiopsis TaxID=54298 RepID=K9U070_CHRTP|nr:MULTISPECIES: PIN domain-containing protein [Chroococcidiopsis]PSB45085.1 PIN domain-containing protein [Cyanosarcina cf. burmensis CCALA 770]AFY88033.1 PilT protein domain protein [Chroococcidiopsis thermalis PCC 7203]MDZ4872570.1 tRNA(fMet)-specific endonuclease VapC [Chroococcidiopsis cubana SAG 39.79]PSB64480.1 PIN domain-containing protein [Chroococcidiopsis cubana CCALA 043]RUT13779.1 twitching motility protein PilT [Chroococcidiopsis cubana SAG 39.79]